ncbi:MAG: hypothetical protein M9895_06165 [Aquamicrobium sp.]|uniref:hypothetical protein n=1 Tax=Aquamicrobium sp. TaxID=1872579 RepID=UPI00349EC8C9|nr:hypothetical protein [Aquamicrobium sp.]
MTGRRIATILIVGFGYLVAVCAAVVVTVALIFSPFALPDDGANGSLFSLLGDLPFILAVGFFWTVSCALPGFIVAILLGESERWEHWWAYAVAGLANAVPSLAIFGVFVGSPFEMPSMVMASFPGGFAGGAAYWLSAGRLVARRRAVASTDVA